MNEYVAYTAVRLPSNAVCELVLDEDNTYAIIGVRGNAETLLKSNIWTLEQAAVETDVIRSNDKSFDRIYITQE